MCAKHAEESQVAADSEQIHLGVKNNFQTTVFALKLTVSQFRACGSGCCINIKIPPSTMLVTGENRHALVMVLCFQGTEHI